MLLKVWLLLRENLLWPVGNGHKIRSWKAPWIPNIGPLINYILVSTNINTDCLLSDLVIEEGTWNLNLFQVWLPKDVIRYIVDIPPLHLSEGPDRVSCCRTLIGAFSFKSVYKMLK